MLLFVIGIAIDGDLYTLGHSQRLAAALAGRARLAGLRRHLLDRRGMGVHGDVTSITFEHGTAFTITAGLMNLLLVLDAFDIAQGRKE